MPVKMNECGWGSYVATATTSKPFNYMLNRRVFPDRETDEDLVAYLGPRRPNSRIR